MKLGVDPTVDLVFKKLFGSETNKGLLISLINAVMQEVGEDLVVEIEIMNPYNTQDFLDDKLSIVDIKAKSELDEWFIIEMQVNVDAYFPQRLLYYWGKSYQQQLKEGEKYHLLRKVTLIAFCKATLPIVTTNYYNHFKVLEVKEKVTLSEHLNIHTIELEKFVNSLEKIGSSLEKWSYFLKHGEDLEDDSIPYQLATPEIEQAIKELKVFTKDEIERERYESRRKALMDRNSLLADRYETGLQKGLQEGKQKGLQEGKQKGLQEGKQEIVTNALKMGLDIETIATLTGLEANIIEEMKKISDESL